MSNGNGHRWSKFWWCDWQNDPGLRMCSLEARGLWIELLAIAHQSDRPGYVLVNGKAPSNREIASLVRWGNAKTIAKLMRELADYGVFSVADDGAIFSRRMVRDAEISEAGREHVSKRYQAHNPEDPTRGATRDPSSKPNGEARGAPYSQAYRDPSTRSLEAEAEVRPPVAPPKVGASPAEPGTPSRPANKTNLRVVGANPRALGTNPRAATPPRVRNGFTGLNRDPFDGLLIDGEVADVDAFLPPNPKRLTDG